MPTSIQKLLTIRASKIAPPPAWALMERNLISLMERSAELFVEKYCYPDGNVFYVQDVDDVYEIFHNWGLLYAMGGDERLWQWALRAWNATTRRFDDRNPLGPPHRNLAGQIHNEYYNQNGPCDWFHMGEGNMALYDMGVADPSIKENVARARKFAAMYTGEDPDAPNYDPIHKIIRSPFHSSVGPLLNMDDVDRVKAYIDPWYRLTGRGIAGFAQRSNLHPVVRDLEEDWHENEQRREEIMRLFDKVVLDGDVADNLAATGLVTHAYLYTGDEKYRQWVLGYTDAWMDRMRRNGGILPDNVGPTGKVGEQRNGQWWGGLYGWNSKWSADHNFISATIAAECALMLTGDYGYVDLIRSQIDLLLDMGVTDDNGQLLVPTRMTERGWEEFRPMNIGELAHVYHSTLSKDDHDLMVQVRDGDTSRDWNEVKAEGGRRGGNFEYARFQYYDGKLPDWPEKILTAEYAFAQTMMEAFLQDDRDFDTIVEDNRWPPCNPDVPDRKDYGGENADPVRTVGLTQVTMGAPRSLYNGGLLRATVRYFDITPSLTLPRNGGEGKKGRPGLPRDVATLVDEIRHDRVGIQFVNMSTNESRSLIVQAGAFSEHTFTDVRYVEEGEGKNPVLYPTAWISEERPQYDRSVRADGKHFVVDLPPSTTIRVEAGMKRFVNQPSYAFPWHV